MLVASLFFLPTAESRETEPSTASRKSAAECVIRALRNEAAGDQASRDADLRAALKFDAESPEANWQAGRVFVGDRWVTIHEAQSDQAAVGQWQAFSRLRDEYDNGSAAGELKLARWCRKRRPDVARMYYARLLNREDIDARTRQEAVSQLGLQNVNGQWLTKSDAKRQWEVAERNAAAWKKWGDKLQRWNEFFASGKEYQRQFASQELTRIDDPYLAPVAEEFAAVASAPFGLLLVDTLQQFREFEATRAITSFAVLSQHAEVREAAVEALKDRPLHDYTPLLMSSIIAPAESSWQVLRMSDGTVRYRHVVFSEGATSNRRLVLRRVGLPRETYGTYHEPKARPTSKLVYQFTGRVKTQNDRLLQEAMERTAEQKEEQLDQLNELLQSRNEPVFRVLESTTGLNLPRDARAWWDWWSEFNETQIVKPTTTLYDDRAGGYAHYNTGPYYQSVSCFVAGTPVTTETGPRPIESIKAGDRVLSQDPRTGELAFKTVCDTTIRAPTELLELTIDGEPIVTTLGHPFWVANKGWRMAKRLEAGDQLHGVGGAIVVERIEPNRFKQPVFNLVVDEFNSYFVGGCQALVHDNTFRKPTTAALPGLERIAP